MPRAPIDRLLDNNKLRLVDIGASGDLEPRWRKIAHHIYPYMFEPDAEAYRALTRSKYPADGKYYNIALADRPGTLPYHMCRKQTVSSNYLPNAAFMGRFDSPERVEVLRTITLPVDTLDRRVENSDAAEIDFLKLDAEGSELRIIQGGRELLKGPVIGLEVEVEFAPIYQSQPMFGDVHAELRNLGFDYLDFTNLVRWEKDQVPRRGQLVFGDALFMRSAEVFQSVIAHCDATLVEAKVKRYLAICLLYRKFDLATRALTLFGDVLPQEHREELAREIAAMRRAEARKDFILRAAFKSLSRLLFASGYDYIPLLKR